MDNKLTMYELSKLLDNAFPELDFRITECATKGTVAIVYFYEDKIQEGITNE
jgi:hypothetical protein